MELTKCTLVMLISSLSATLVIKKSGVLDPIINTNISVQTDIVWIIQHYITTVKKITVKIVSILVEQWDGLRSSVNI